MESVPLQDRQDRFAWERQLLKSGEARVAGVDEAGRGPLAGPVVAAAVILPSCWIREGIPSALRDLNDSKQLSARRRDVFFELLQADSQIERAIAVASPETIDRLNILGATHGAMNRALAQLNVPPQVVLVDGLRVPSLRWRQIPIVGGDGRSYSIAAASVLAKVTRDRLMLELDRDYPHYGFARHKGYPTPDHLEALRKHGPCPAHRRSFAPLRLRQAELFTAR